MMSIQKRGAMGSRFLAVFAIVILAQMLGACSCSDNTAPTEQAGLKVYRVALDQTPRDLDPAHSSTLYQNHIVLNLYDTLYSYEYLARPYKLKPRLAVELPEVSADGLTYTIRLRKGVRFMDDPAFEEGKGREVTAADVVYSLKRHFDPETLSSGDWFWKNRIKGLDAWKEAGADYAQPVEGLQAPDSHTLVIRLTKPYPQLVHTLAQGYAGVVPREAVARYGRELATHPVGSGPYKLEKFDSTQVVLVRNPGYREDRVDLAAEGFDPALHGGLGLERIDGLALPISDRVHVYFIAEDTARVTSLTKGGELHTARLPALMYEQFLASTEPAALKSQYAEQFNMVAGLESGFVYMNFNLDDPDFGVTDDPAQSARNKALRCAIFKGFDWQLRNSAYYSNLGEIFPGIITPTVPEFDPNLPRDTVTRDVPGAKKLLTEAGWNADNLPELVYGIPSSVLQTQYFEQFRGFMGDIGYPRDKIVLKRYATFGDIAKAWRNSELPLIYKGWTLDYPDAENTLQLFYGPNAAPGSNDSNYRNPAYDRLFEEASVMQPGTNRTAIYRRMNQMVIDDCVSTTGLSRTQVLLWDKRVAAYPDRGFVGGFYFPYVDVPAQER
ncbi:MAG: ABC transporter substrate-binding protein [Pseudomonadota bacterium]